MSDLKEMFDDMGKALVNTDDIQYCEYCDGLRYSFHFINDEGGCQRELEDRQDAVMMRMEDER
jgi:hypothetical protein